MKMTQTHTVLHKYTSNDARQPHKHFYNNSPIKSAMCDVVTDIQSNIKSNGSSHFSTSRSLFPPSSPASGTTANVVPPPVRAQRSNGFTSPAAFTQSWEEHI